MRCPHCEHENPDQGRACSSCGLNLDPTTSYARELEDLLTDLRFREVQDTRNKRGDELDQSIVAWWATLSLSEQEEIKRKLSRDPEILRRALASCPKQKGMEAKPPGRTRLATKRQTAKVEGGQLVVSYPGGPLRTWLLPQRNQLDEIRRVRDEAVAFAEENGATLGQANAVKKALTDARYFVSR